MKLVIGVGALVLIVLGALYLSAPPVISVAPEHIFTIAGVGITNTMFTSWIVVLILCVIGIVAGRGLSVVPSGFSGAVEALVSGFLGIVTGIAGEQNGRRFFWVIATIFFYILTSNYFGLLPINGVIGKPEVGHGETQVIFKEANIGGLKVAYIPLSPETCKAAECPSQGEHGAAPAGHGAAITSGVTAPASAVAKDGHGASADAKGEGQVSGIIAPYLRSVNTDVNTPLAIALFSFVFVEYWGLSTLGLGYLKKFFNFGALLHGKPMGLIDVFVGLLELISELSRTVSFTFRLFGNVFAGEVLLTMMTALVPLMIIQVFYALELLVGVIQAFVFAMLTLVFAQMAVAHHGGGEGHGEAHGEAQH